MTTKVARQTHPRSFFRQQDGLIVESEYAMPDIKVEKKVEPEDGAHIRPRDSIVDRLSYLLGFN